VYTGDYQACVSFKRAFLDDDLRWDIVRVTDYNPPRVEAPPAKPFPEPISADEYQRKFRQRPDPVVPDLSKKKRL
jgi:hypothetical protein